MIINNISKNCENEYLGAVADLINLPSEFDLVLSVWSHDVPQTERPKVVLLTSHEEHGIPTKWTNDSSVKLIFTQYLGPVHPKLFGLPLGWSEGFKTVYKPIRDRKYLFSFIGAINDSGRREMLQSLSKLPESLRSQGFIHTYEGWNNGLGMEKYAEIMGETKIALCPPGYISQQSFRYFESMKAGCLIVGSDFSAHGLHARLPWYNYNGTKVQNHQWHLTGSILETLHHTVDQPFPWQPLNDRLVADYIDSDGLVTNWLQPIINRELQLPC